MQVASPSFGAKADADEAQGMRYWGALDCGCARSAGIGSGSAHHSPAYHADDTVRIEQVFRRSAAIPIR
jgi:hypothetical protein